jgi:hypothetical protein
MEIDAPVAFATSDRTSPAIQIRVNFGIVAGREATPAEIDTLARNLLQIVKDVSIIAEQHYEIGHGGEAVVHLINVEVDLKDLRDSSVDVGVVTSELIDAATHWAEACAEERHAAGL